MANLLLIANQNNDLSQVIVSAIVTVIGIVLKHYYNKNKYDLNSVKKNKKENNSNKVTN